MLVPLVKIVINYLQIMSFMSSFKIPWVSTAGSPAACLCPALLSLSLSLTPLRSCALVGTLQPGVVSSMWSGAGTASSLPIHTGFIQCTLQVRRCA